MPYVCNHTRLDLAETGFGSDVPLEVLQEDVTDASYAGYVAPDFIPAHGQSAGTHGGGTNPVAHDEPEA